MDQPAPKNSNTLLIVGIVVLVLTLLLVHIGFAGIGIVAAIAIPNFVTMQLRAKRSEVPSNVDAILTAELAYDAAFDSFVPCGSEEEARVALSKNARPWEGGECWEKLGWRPDGMVRGGYWVEVNENVVTIHGICDVDGDGEFAEYKATIQDGRAKATTLTTGSHVF